MPFVTTNSLLLKFDFLVSRFLLAEFSISYLPPSKGQETFLDTLLLAE